MTKIKNPYLNVKDYNCFGCAPGNENGLRMEFETDGEVVTCTWEPKTFMQGYNNVLHGGIQATLMDEVGAWLVNIRLHTSGVTSKMETRFIKPVYVDGGPLFLRAELKQVRHKMAFIYASLKNSDGVLCAESQLIYYVMNPREATEKYAFPGIDAFLP